MQFLHPGVLYFFPAIAVPVIIHLFNFRRYKKVYFTNVGFLEEFAKEHKSRNRIREFLLLLFRTLCILFLILAFSGLNFSLKKNSIPDKSLFRLVEVYLDNSQSMNLLGVHGTLLEEAKKKISELTDLDLPGQEPIRYGLITNDFSGSDFAFLEKQEFLNLVSRTGTSLEHKSLTQILNRFKEMNAQMGDHPKSTFLFSDFQKDIYPDSNHKSFGNLIKSFDTTENLRLRLVHFKPKEQFNYYIDSAWNLSPVQKTGESNSLVVRIKRSYSGNPNSLKDFSLPVKLVLNGEIKSLGLVHFKEQNKILDTLHFQITRSGGQEIEVKIEDEPISFDNSFYASWDVPDFQEVVCIYGDKPNGFLESVYKTESYFKYVSYKEDQVDYNHLSKSGFVLLDGLKHPGSGLVQELKKVINRGGRLVYIPGAMDSLNMVAWLAGQNSFLGNFMGSPDLKWIRKNQEIEMPLANNPILSGVFDKFPKSMTMPWVHQYFQLNTKSTERKKNILNLQGKIPYLVEFPKPNGSFFLFTGSFGSSCTNFTNTPLFLPVFYNLALQSQNFFPLDYTLGKYETFKTGNWNREDMLHASFMGDSLAIIPRLESKTGNTLDLGSGPKHSGFYHLILNGKKVQTFAFNYDRSESELVYFKEEDLKNNSYSLLLNENEPWTRIRTFSDREEEFLLPIWKVCLILALLSLAAEQILIHKKSPA